MLSLIRRIVSRQFGTYALLAHRFMQSLLFLGGTQTAKKKAHVSRKTPKKKRWKYMFSSPQVGKIPIFKEVIVRLVDIGGIVDHHCANFV